MNPDRKFGARRDGEEYSLISMIWFGKMTRTTRWVIHLAISAVLASCAVQPATEENGEAAQLATTPAADASSVEGRTASSATDAVTQEGSAPATATERRDVAVLGSGTFVRGVGADRDSGAAYAGDDAVTLNFEKASLPEFLRVVFETILGENYMIDPKINGWVTLRTTRPVPRSAVISIVESVLEQNGAALVIDEGVYRFVALSDAEAAAGRPAVGRYPSSSGAGYGIQVVPLEHVSAGEIEQLLGPFVPAGSSLRADRARNVLILSGPRHRIDDLLATIRTFDVDWLKGMSFAMFRLDYADAASVVSELEAVLASEGESPLAGIVRLVPVERLNAVLVIAHRPDHIAGIQSLVEQFDWGLEGTSGRRLFVYELENGIAEHIAGILQQIFGGGVRGEPALVAGRPAAQTEQSRVFRAAESMSRLPPAPGDATIGGLPVQQRPAAAGGPDTGEGTLAESRSDVTIIADKDNNAILVMATQQDYRVIEGAIRRLDIPPRQVLIEATIAEVTLSDTLTYGVRWFLEKSNFELGFNAPVPSEASGEGLAFAFFDDSSDLEAFFDILATASSVKFLSTPQVMVLDNQTASIRVGDQIPVTTRSSQGTTDPEAPIIREVQYRDTGTLLTVTPNINAGGQITLDISQEVSVPGTEPAVGGGGNVSIAQRTINSSVIVQDGQTVVLGGLIRETTSDGKSGIPILMDLPGLGYLFSSSTEDTFRTELIVTVRPVVVENRDEMKKITDELRERMAKANEYERSVR